MEIGPLKVDRLDFSDHHFFSAHVSAAISSFFLTTVLLSASLLFG